MQIEPEETLSLDLSIREENDSYSLLVESAYTDGRLVGNLMSHEYPVNKKEFQKIKKQINDIDESIFEKENHKQLDMFEDNIV